MRELSDEVLTALDQIRLLVPISDQLDHGIAPTRTYEMTPYSLALAKAEIRQCIADEITVRPYFVPDDVGWISLGLMMYNQDGVQLEYVGHGQYQPIELQASLRDRLDTLCADVYDVISDIDGTGAPELLKDGQRLQDELQDRVREAHGDVVITSLAAGELSVCMKMLCWHLNEPRSEKGDS